MTNPDATPATPTVPARVRTATYYIGLAIGALTLAATGLAPIWLSPDLADQVASSAGVISGVGAFIAGGLGVIYRPTRNHTVADGTAVEVRDTGLGM